MVSPAEKQRRSANRLLVSLPVRVESKDPGNEIHREITNSESVSDIGAGFYINRLFEIGQLVLLKIPLNKKLRRYDFDSDLYEVWALVRHCHRIARANGTAFHIGVAFIGAEPPPSYKLNPLTTYELVRLRLNGFWEVKEAEEPVSTRRQRRYPIPIEIYIAVFDDDDNIIAHETTVTENISKGGAAVFSGLELKVGDEVELIKRHGGFAAKAIVRDRRVGDDKLPRIHLEFIDVSFPLEGID